MFQLEQVQPKSYPRTIAGARSLARDWLNTPHPEERIVIAWPLDLLCGLLLLTPPILAHIAG